MTTQTAPWWRRIFGRKPAPTMPVAVRGFVPHPTPAFGSRRQDGWPIALSGPNRDLGMKAPQLRKLSRALVRDNAIAHAVVREWTTLVVGGGFVANSTPEAEAIWSAWMKQCDAQGAGRDWNTVLRTLVRAAAEGGGAFLRRRPRRPGDTVDGTGTSEPLKTLVQVQVLEAEQLNWHQAGTTYGVELDPLDRPRAYHFFRRHPDEDAATRDVVRVPAGDIAHFYDATARPGVLHGLPLLTPVMQDLFDLGGVREALRVKERIAASLAVILEGTADQLTTPAGVPRPLGTDRTDGLAVDSDGARVDGLEPGIILRAPNGMSAKVVNPPQASGYDAKYDAHLIASGAGITYPRMTGDLSQVNYSSGKLGEANAWARVRTTRDVLKAMVLDRVWRWVMQAAVMSGDLAQVPPVEWIDTPEPTLDPQKEAQAASKMMEIGAWSWGHVSRRYAGSEPERHLAELADEVKRFAELGLKHPMAATPPPMPTVPDEATVSG